MDILLRIESVLERDSDEGRRAPRHLGDVVLTVEPSHTVTEIRRALVEHFGLVSEPYRALCRPGQRGVVEYLPEGLTVVDLVLTMGETLILSASHSTAVRHRRRAHNGSTIDGPGGDGRGDGGRSGYGGNELVVASGPDAGARVPLRAGRLSVGRDQKCSLTLTDPLVSRRQLLLDVGQDGGGIIEPIGGAPGARNPVRLDGTLLIERRPLTPGQIIVIGGSSLVVRPRVRCGPASKTLPDGEHGQVLFDRTPEFGEPVEPVLIEPLDEIPSTPERPRFAYLSAIVPLLMGVGFGLAFGSRYLLFALLSPVMLVGNHLEHRRRHGRRFAESIERFERQLEARVVEARSVAAVERQRRFDAAPDVAELVDRAIRRSANLWIRGARSPGFLSLRLGIGTLPASMAFRANSGGDPVYRDRVDEMLGPYATMIDVPVSLNLAELGAVGLVGSAEDVTATARSLLVQIGCLHSPQEVAVVAAVEASRGVADWLKWFPHCRVGGPPAAASSLAVSSPDAEVLLTELLAEATRRATATETDRPSPWLLAVLDRTLDLDASMVSRLLDLCPDVAMSILWLGDSVERVPRQVRSVVHCRPAISGRQSSIVSTDPAVADRLLDIERLDAAVADRVARALAPLRDAARLDGSAVIPPVVSLFESLGVEDVDDDQIIEWWKTDRGYSLPAPIGLGERGPVQLDVVAHGPHGLIGGTSGAGKSELIMSLVGGLIAMTPPSRLNLLFIDYKGGASSNVFAGAPHTVGHVTNLDGLLATRALTSLRAELDRRMRLLNGRAKDLAEFIARCPSEAPPSLVIVVDEFATLINEVPSFVEGIVDIAQRGRSLGIHLLLATQRPSGSVNDNITANANLRISLRMLEGAESSAVIGSPVAAEISPALTGRGYVRFGGGEPQLFQSAWAGASARPAPSRTRVAVAAFTPARTEADAAVATKTIEPAEGGVVEATTQLDVVLAAVGDAAARLGCEIGQPPWLDPLPSLISLASVRAEADADVVQPGVTIAFGLVDDAAAQAQYPAVVDLGQSGGLLITGAGGAGKTAALVTLATSAAIDDDNTGSPGLNHGLIIIGVDATSRGLQAIARLPQCAAVAAGDDLEAVTRVVHLLHRELDRRRSRGVTSPSVLLLIDGFDGLTQLMEHGATVDGLAPYFAELVSVITDGRQHGIHTILTATRRSAVRPSVAAAMSQRLTLRQAETHDYVECGLGSAEAAALELSPGQGFLNGQTVVQVALPVDGEIDSLAARCGEVSERFRTSALPIQVPLLPTEDPLRPVVGLTDHYLTPFALDLRHENALLVGDPRSGRSTALAVIGEQAGRAGADVVAVARPGTPLSNVGGRVVCCTGEGESRALLLAEWLASIKDAPPLNESSTPRLLLLDDVDLLPEHDHDVLAVLDQLLGLVRFVAACSTPRGFVHHPVVQRVRSSRSIVYLRPHDGRDATDVLAAPVRWHPGLVMTEGRGYVSVDRVPTMVQFSNPAY